MVRTSNRLFNYVLILTAVLLLLSCCIPLVHAEGTTSLEQAIIDSCTYEQKVDLSQYAVTTQDLESTFQSLCDSHRLPWYANTEYNYYYDTTTDLVTEFEPIPLEGIDKTRYEQRVAEILDECVLEGMSQWQIALSIHDYLIANTCYDETLAYNSGYHLLVDGTAVCAGYAEAYQDLMTRAGIPCLYVISEAMEHAWNLVQLNGCWYHVDLTWDDPTPDTYGFVSHAYFLLTDEEISSGEEPHYSWDTDIACTDTTFSDAFWKDVESQICFTDVQNCFFIRENDFTNRIVSRNCSTASEITLYTDKLKYVNIGAGSYGYPRFGLSLWDGRLYLCSSDKIVSMATDGTDIKTEYQHAIKSDHKVICGCFTSNGIVYLSLMTHEGDQSAQTHTLSTGSFHIHSYTVTVNTPTCTASGSTVSVCACGLRCESSPTAATGHSYTQTEQVSATYFSAGHTVDTCSGCGDVLTQTIPRLHISAKDILTLAALAVLIFLPFVLRKHKVRT